MKALSNILQDILFQFRISGGLIARLSCVGAYYSVYTFHRIRGLDRDRSRLRAVAATSRLGASRREVTILLPDGSQMTLDLMAASFLPKEFISERTYTKLPQFLPRPGQTIVDVGAHQGMFSIPAARQVGPDGKVISIEPHPDNLKRLTRNKEANGIKHLCIVPVAAANFSGATDFFVTPLGSGGHSLFIRSEGDLIAQRDSIPIQARKLDDILQDAGVFQPDLIKIDVEGAALSVLDSAPRTLASRPRLILEVEGTQKEMQQVRRYLEARGYQTTQFDSILYAESGTQRHSPESALTA